MMKPWATKKTLSDEIDEELILPKKGGSDDEFNPHPGRFKSPYKRKKRDTKREDSMMKTGYRAQNSNRYLYATVIQIQL